MRDLSGATVVVVGASGELGRRVAHGLAERGARLVLAGRDPDRLARVGVPEARLVTVDLRDPGYAGALVAAAREGGTELTGTVYAAGVVGFGAVTEVDDDDVDELLLLNFLAPSRLIRAALPVLPAGGFVATISAVVAEQPPARMAHYAASKAAMSAFDASVRHEARRAKVSVIDVRPPHTETGLAGRAITGTAPKLPTGKDPDAVAARIVTAITDDEPEVPAASF